MTGGQVKGKSFRGALRYNQEKVAAGKAEVIDNSFVNASERGIMKEVAMVRMQRPDLKKYFYHTSINFPKDENLSNELMVKIGRDYLDANGFNQHQYIMFRHYDADHPHFHILVNRIGYDGSVVTDSNDYARSEKVLRNLERKYNLMQVTSSKQAQNRGLTKNEIEMVRRSKMPSHKLAMQIIIRNVLETKKEMTTDEFISALSAKNIDVILNQASTGYVSGISYRYQGMVIQGSKLGNAFKWSSIKNTINYEQERDSPIIHVLLQRYKKIADKESNTDLLIYPPTFTVKGFGAAVENSKRTIQQAIDGAVDRVLKMPNLFPLKTLVDSNRGDEPDMIDRELKKEQQRKKRRGLRR